MTLEDFNKEELIAIVRKLGRENWIKDWERQALRYGLTAREEKISGELENSYLADIATLRELADLGRQYDKQPVKDIPPADLERIMSLQAKYDKAQKRQQTLRKREDECFKQRTALWEVK